ncbi:MAG: hypothetical protein H7Y43_16075 [Akkermansiaceae bacterium]|nr:hypothetical protein [Verrucomicrobiales bacterium]
MKSGFICAHIARLALAFVLVSTARPGQSQAAPAQNFSKFSSVTLFLADAKRGVAGEGLTHAFWERDGRTEVSGVEGVECRSLSLANPEAAKGYFYFTLDPTFKEQDVSRVRIDVEYFDGMNGKAGVFGLQYDATGSPNGSSSKPLLPNVALNGSGRWLTNSFHVRDGGFQNAQNARSDFRLWASPAELSVSRVTVTRESDAPMPKPLAFDAAGEAKLREWNRQWDSGARPSFSGGTNETDGVRWLEVRAEVAGAGSWRTAPLLEAGNYQFVGRARATDSAGGNAVMLRVSGRPSAGSARLTSEWRTLTYDFTVAALEHVELACEFRGEQGGARFDVDSLKLVRKSKAAP